MTRAAAIALVLLASPASAHCHSVWFYAMSALLGIGLLAHGWYLLMSEPKEGFTPPYSHRLLRLARGGIVLAFGFLCGGYALTHIDPVFSASFPSCQLTIQP